MARNEHFRRHPVDRAPVDRAPLRAGFHAPARSWHALANVAVASTLVVAVVVGVLALLESVLAPAGSRLARHAPNPSGTQSWHARTQPHEPFLPTPTQPEPALLVSD